MAFYFSQSTKTFLPMFVCIHKQWTKTVISIISSCSAAKTYVKDQQHLSLSLQSRKCDTQALPVVALQGLMHGVCALFISGKNAHPRAHAFATLVKTQYNFSPLSQGRSRSLILRQTTLMFQQLGAETRPILFYIHTHTRAKQQQVLED